VSRTEQESPSLNLPEGLFAPNWPSLERYTVQPWYVDGKFGIFIHWGLYAVPAFGNEWYCRNMYLEGKKEFEHHLATDGPQAQFGYKDSSLCSRRTATIRPAGQNSSAAPAPASSCRWPSTTTDSPCTLATVQRGAPPR
jgi:hypothetical protein